jgi:hypothetical protein
MSLCNQLMVNYILLVKLPQFLINLGQKFGLDAIDPSTAREAQGHFVHACSLDPDNQAAKYYLKMVGGVAFGIASMC